MLPGETSAVSRVIKSQISQGSSGIRNSEGQEESCLAIQTGQASSEGRVPTGWAEEICVNDAHFRWGLHERFTHTTQQGVSHNATPKRGHRERKRAREDTGNPSIVYGPGAYKGPWARFIDEDVSTATTEAISATVTKHPKTSDSRPNVNPATNSVTDADTDTDADVEIVYVYEEDQIEEQPSAPSKAGTDYVESEHGRETSQLHASQAYDYLGRTYMHVPQDLGINLHSELDVHDIKNYVPKRLIHTWKQHTKPITQMRFIPDSGHLLLSASADGTAKLWDVYHERELLRTYKGHDKSVNDICFNATGRQFLTSSYDRYMKLWDTETGKCISRFTTGKTAHCIRFNPDVNINHEFLAGMADKKIVQFDIRSGEQVQEYDHHLGAVNTITFCDENRRFITTSDDKSLRAWEYGIPVPIKFIAEPYMYSMVRAAHHPVKPCVLFQSSDNQMVVYAATDRFRQNCRKVFRGHNNAGYAIDVAISPDGCIVMSGDTGGYVCFWDWKTCKMWHKILASETPVVSCQWHPRETSKVVTGDLNGVIKYWD